MKSNILALIFFALFTPSTIFAANRPLDPPPGNSETSRPRYSQIPPSFVPSVPSTSHSPSGVKNPSLRDLGIWNAWNYIEFDFVLQRVQDDVLKAFIVDANEHFKKANAICKQYLEGRFNAKDIAEALKEVSDIKKDHNIVLALYFKYFKVNYKSTNEETKKFLSSIGTVYLRGQESTLSDCLIHLKNFEDLLLEENEYLRYARDAEKSVEYVVSLLSILKEQLKSGDHKDILVIKQEDLRAPSLVVEKISQANVRLQRLGKNEESDPFISWRRLLFYEKEQKRFMHLTAFAKDVLDELGSAYASMDKSPKIATESYFESARKVAGVVGGYAESVMSGIYNRIPNVSSYFVGKPGVPAASHPEVQPELPGESLSSGGSPSQPTTVQSGSLKSRVSEGSRGGGVSPKPKSEGSHKLQNEQLDS